MFVGMVSVMGGNNWEIWELDWDYNGCNLTEKSCLVARQVDEPAMA